MTIVADSKDWTWVLTRRCPECGFDTASVPREAVADLTRETARRFREVLAAGSSTRERSQPDKWSHLEYAAHVRDVYRIFTYRLGLMMTEDGPRFPNWDQDATAIAERYHEQDPVIVGEELSAAAEALAVAFEAVPADAWGRTGHRSDGADFTVETFARYFIHDPIHHLYDCGVRMA